MSTMAQSKRNKATRGLTAYEAAKRVNEALKEARIDKRIPPQMMYNYTHARVREGKRPLIAYTKRDGIDEADFNNWLAEYIDRQSDTSHEV